MGQGAKLPCCRLSVKPIIQRICGFR